MYESETLKEGYSGSNPKMGQVIKKDLLSLALGLTLAFGILQVGVPATANETYRSPTLINFLNQYQTSQKRNHILCFAYEDTTPGLPCNPAQIALHKESQTWLYLHGNDNLDYFENVADILDGPMKVKETLSLLNHNSSQQFQFSSSLGYRTEHWGFSIVPESLLLFTHIRNPSLPRLTLLAARESQLQFQAGYFFHPEWAWGLQARAAFRRFSYNDTFLPEHFTETGRSLYPIYSQTSFYLEPSLLFAPQNIQLKPQFAIMATNGGWSSENYSPFNQDPNILTTLSVSAPIGKAQLRFGGLTQWTGHDGYQTHYSGLGAELNLYEFTLYTTLFELEKQVGFALNAESFTLGISYSEQDWNQTPSSSAQSLWRWDFGFRF